LLFLHSLGLFFGELCFQLLLGYGFGLGSLDLLCLFFRLGKLVLFGLRCGNFCSCKGFFISFFLLFLYSLIAFGDCDGFGLF